MVKAIDGWGFDSTAYISRSKSLPYSSSMLTARMESTLNNSSL
jgi:hypothetical protein